MIDFEFRAREKGAVGELRGTIQADSERAAAKLLTEKGLFVIALKPKGESWLNNIRLFNKVPGKQRVIFTRQLSTLVKAGLPITQALTTATEQVDNKKFKEILNNVRADVEGGLSLSQSFSKYPDVFNNVYISMVKAGETSGNLDVTLERLATQQEKDLAIISKVRGALIYPAIVLVVILLVIGFMLVTVLPQIQLLYEGLKKGLPITTRVLLILSNFVIHFWYLVLLLILGTVFGLRAYVKTPQGRRQFHKMLLKLPPPFGTLMRKIYMARFTRSLGTLVSSGVPLLEALRISGESINNRILEAGVEDAMSDVKSGKALSASIAKNPYFLSLVPQMMRIGEESGTLGDMLDKVALFYEDEVDQTVKNLSTLIEPLLMIVLGGMVFFIIIAVLFPVYNLVGQGFDVNGVNTSNTLNTVTK